MRLAHLHLLAEKMGIDGLAICGNEVDCTFFNEYNFEGLMNEPWYERINENGNEMRSLFRTAEPSQGPQKKASSPNSMKGSSEIDSLSDLDYMKNNCSKRQRRKRFGSNVLSDDDHLTLDRKRHQESVANKDLLNTFQQSLPKREEDSKEMLAELLDANTTKGDEETSRLMLHLLESFRQA